MSRETRLPRHRERKSRDSAANRDGGALAFQTRLTSFRLTHGTNSHAAAELVRTKLEMGRAARLSFARAFRGWMRPPGILVCNRHNETIGCLQNRARPRASEPGCDRSDRLTDFANGNRVGQQQRKWTNRPGEPIDPAEWPKRESYALRRGDEICGPLGLSNDDGEN
jgi:hypothetical protein